MAAITNVLGLLLVLGLIAKGNSQQCTLKELEVVQYKTGKEFQNETVFQVHVFNRCKGVLCYQKDVKLNCKGFQTAQNIDPSILQVQGDVCLVKNGQPIYNDGAVNFQYAWSYRFDLSPISSTAVCP